MINMESSKEALLEAVAKLQEKKDLAAAVGPDWYEPGRMQNLDQYLGQFDESSRAVTIRTESKGLRYDERTPRLDYLSVGDPVRLVREPGNPFNANNIRQPVRTAVQCDRSAVGCRSACNLLCPCQLP